MNFVLHGHAVSGGITIGYAHLVTTARLEVVHYEIPQAAVEAEVRKQLTRWFGPEAGKWRMLRIHRIRDAHPMPQPSSIQQLPVQLSDTLYVCGDHRYFPSIQAALLTGRHAAEAVIKNHG